MTCVIGADLTGLLPAMKRWARRFGVNQNDAEDILQETCCRAVKAQRSYIAGSNFPAWIRAIMWNVAKESRRGLAAKALRQTSSLDESLDNIEAAGREGNSIRAVDIKVAKAMSVKGRQEDHVSLLEAIDRMRKMPASYQRALCLIVQHGMSYQEAADELGITPQTVMNNVSLARKELNNAT